MVLCHGISELLSLRLRSVQDGNRWDGNMEFVLIIFEMLFLFNYVELIFLGHGRGRGAERGRSGYRGGRGGGRGSYRGGYQHSSSQGQFGSNITSAVWDNSQALKVDSSKEWTNTSAATVDDSAEDTEWVRFVPVTMKRL